MATVVIGRVRKPHGVRGAVKVESYSGEATHFRTLTAVELVRDNHVRPMEITSVAVHNGVPVIQFAGIDTPEAARVFSGWEIRVERDKAAKLGDNEYYVADLVGATVLVNGERAGRVRAVVDGAQAPLLEVELSAGGVPVLVPFMERFVGDVNIDAGQIEISERWILDTE
jgi:16S rRNA processing protein RimM